MNPHGNDLELRTYHVLVVAQMTEALAFDCFVVSHFDGSHVILADLEAHY